MGQELLSQDMLVQGGKHTQRKYGSKLFQCSKVEAYKPSKTHLIPLGHQKKFPSLKTQQEGNVLPKGGGQKDAWIRVAKTIFLFLMVGAIIYTVNNTQ